jgi:hypothetical protein
MKCCFSTDITDELSCSPNGQFDDYGERALLYLRHLKGGGLC